LYHASGYFLPQHRSVKELSQSNQRATDERIVVIPQRQRRESGHGETTED
jgi:hypothetical protein